MIALLVLAGCGGNGDSEEGTGRGGGATTTMAGMEGMEGMEGMAGDGEHGAHGDHGGGECSPSGTTVSIVASNTSFNTACIAAPADQPFTLTYENRDSIGHNIVLLESHTATDPFFRADIFTGPRTMTFDVAPIRAGTYAFHCEVHPSVMTGTFIVR